MRLLCMLSLPVVAMLLHAVEGTVGMRSGCVGIRLTEPCLGDVRFGMSSIPLCRRPRNVLEPRD
jgi:hypothetical protein